MSDAGDFMRRRALVLAALKNSAPTGGGGAPGTPPAKPPDASGTTVTSGVARGVVPSPVVIPPPKLPGTGGKGPRSHSVKQLRAEQRREVRLFGESPPLPVVERPKTRGDCEGGDRPCPFLGCRHHTAVEVQPTGSLVVNFPGKPVEELTASCSLDVADLGGVTLEEAGAVLNLTRERVRQVEQRALQKVAAQLEPKFKGSCKARCAESGRTCKLPAHGPELTHRNERGPFHLVAADGQTHFPEKRRLDEQAERNPAGMALLEASHV